MKKLTQKNQAKNQAKKQGIVSSDDGTHTSSASNHENATTLNVDKQHDELLNFIQKQIDTILNSVEEWRADHKNFDQIGFYNSITGLRAISHHQMKSKKCIQYNINNIGNAVDGAKILALTVFNLDKKLDPLKHGKLYAKSTVALALIANVFYALGTKQNAQGCWVKDSSDNKHSLHPYDLAVVISSRLQTSPHGFQTFTLTEQYAIAKVLWIRYRRSSGKEKIKYHHLISKLIENSDYSQFKLDMNALLMETFDAKTVSESQSVLYMAITQCKKVVSANEIIACLNAAKSLFSYYASQSVDEVTKFIQSLDFTYYEDLCQFLSCLDYQKCDDMDNSELQNMLVEITKTELLSDKLNQLNLAIHKMVKMIFDNGSRKGKHSSTSTQYNPVIDFAALDRLALLLEELFHQEKKFIAHKVKSLKPANYRGKNQALDNAKRGFKVVDIKLKNLKQIRERLNPLIHGDYTPETVNNNSSHPSNQQMPSQHPPSSKCESNARSQSKHHEDGNVIQSDAHMQQSDVKIKALNSTKKALSVVNNNINAKYHYIKLQKYDDCYESSQLQEAYSGYFQLIHQVKLLPSNKIARFFIRYLHCARVLLKDAIDKNELFQGLKINRQRNHAIGICSKWLVSVSQSEEVKKLQREICDYDYLTAYYWLSATEHAIAQKNFSQAKEYVNNLNQSPCYNSSIIELLRAKVLLAHGDNDKRRLVKVMKHCRSAITISDELRHDEYNQDMKLSEVSEAKLTAATLMLELSTIDNIESHYQWCLLNGNELDKQTLANRYLTTCLKIKKADEQQQRQCYARQYGIVTQYPFTPKQTTLFKSLLEYTPKYKIAYVVGGAIRDNFNGADIDTKLIMPDDIPLTQAFNVRKFYLENKPKDGQPLRLQFSKYIKGLVTTELFGYEFDIHPLYQNAYDPTQSSAGLTINDIKVDVDTCKLYDPTHLSWGDIQEKIVRLCVDNLEDNAIILLRACRFASLPDYHMPLIDQLILKALSPQLSSLNHSQLIAELCKVFSRGNSAPTINKYMEMHLIQYLFPELQVVINKNKEIQSWIIDQLNDLDKLQQRGEVICLEKGLAILYFPIFSVAFYKYLSSDDIKYQSTKLSLALHAACNELESLPLVDLLRAKNVLYQELRLHQLKRLGLFDYYMGNMVQSSQAYQCDDVVLTFNIPNQHNVPAIIDSRSMAQFKTGNLLKYIGIKIDDLGWILTSFSIEAEAHGFHQLRQYHESCLSKANEFKPLQDEPNYYRNVLSSRSYPGLFIPKSTEAVSVAVATFSKEERCQDNQPSSAFPASF